MTTAYTSLLGLALPTTGELQGTWGDTVNNSITSLLDSAVAGTTTLSTDGDVTLSTTTGAANQARQAILLCSGARTAQRTITAPAQSKIYTVINNTTGGYAVKLVGVGPTTGVTIPAGYSGTFAWNGSDFVDVSNYVSGNKYINGNLTVTGNLTLSGGTANGVAYLNGSKVVTTGSALVFDGTALGVGGAPVNNRQITAKTAGQTDISIVAGSTNYAQLLFGYTGADNKGIISYYNVDNSMAFYTNGTEAMRLTSTGLGIGTSSPAAKLDVIGSSSDQLRLRSDAGAYYRIGRNSSDGLLDFYASQTGFQGYRFGGIDGTWMTLNTSGNLGLGVTPSAWSTYTALQVKTASLWSGNSLNSFASLTANAYYQGGYKYIASDYATEYYQYQGAHVWRTTASGTAGNAITFTQAMTLTAAGRLGLGLTNPSFLFEAYGGAAGTSSELTVGNASTAARFGVDTSNEVTVATGQAVPIKFLTSNTERARIDSSGRLLIGNTTPYDNATLSVTSPSQLYSVISDGGTTGNRSRGGFAHPSTKVFALNVDQADGVLAFYQNGNTERGRFDSGGRFLVGTTSSGGATSNIAPVVAGAFRTQYGVTSIASTGVATTVMTFNNNDGDFIVSMRGSGTGAPTTDDSVAIICVNAGNASQTNLKTGSNIVISMSGLNLQVTQSLFAGANVSWSVMRISA